MRVKFNVLNPQSVVDPENKKQGRGELIKVTDNVKFLQKEKRRVRELRAIQIERAMGKSVPMFKMTHPCYLDDSNM